MTARQRGVPVALIAATGALVLVSSLATAGVVLGSSGLAGTERDWQPLPTAAPNGRSAVLLPELAGPPRAGALLPAPATLDGSGSRATRSVTPPVRAILGPRPTDRPVVAALPVAVPVDVPVDAPVDAPVDVPAGVPVDLPVVPTAPGPVAAPRAPVAPPAAAPVTPPGGQAKSNGKKKLPSNGTGTGKSTAEDKGNSQSKGVSRSKSSGQSTSAAAATADGARTTQPEDTGSKGNSSKGDSKDKGKGKGNEEQGPSRVYGPTVPTPASPEQTGDTTERTGARGGSGKAPGRDRS